jgi:hypothetical protein
LRRPAGLFTRCSLAACLFRNRPRKEQIETIRATRLADNRFIHLAQGGPAAGFDKHAAILAKIFGSVKVIGK